MKEKDGICPRFGAFLYQNILSPTDRLPFSKQLEEVLSAKDSTYVIVSE